MTEHGLQAAYFAQAEAAPPPLIVAALLHDIGHLIESVPEDIAEWTTDAHHEETWRPLARAALRGGDLRTRAPARPGQTLPVCNRPAVSRQTQPSLGGHADTAGRSDDRARAVRFEAERFPSGRVRVRRWDDAGKVAGLETPGLLAYRAMMTELAARRD